MHSAMQWSVDQWQAVKLPTTTPPLVAHRQQRQSKFSAWIVKNCAINSWPCKIHHVGAVSATTSNRRQCHKKCSQQIYAKRTAFVFVLYSKTRKIESSKKNMHVWKWQAVPGRSWLRDVAVNRRDPRLYSMRATLRIMWNHLSGESSSSVSMAQPFHRQMGRSDGGRGSHRHNCFGENWGQ